MKKIYILILKAAIACFLVWIARNISDTFLSGGITGIIFTGICVIFDEEVLNDRE